MKKPIKLVYLHCSLDEKSNKENLKVINTLPNKSGNSASLNK